LVNSKAVLIPEMEGFRRVLDFSILSEMEFALHPSLKLSNAFMQELEAQNLFNKSKLMPDVNLGYSNLSIIGWQSPDGLNQKYYGAGRRFGIYQLGLGIPIFNGSTKAKIKASGLDIEIAQLEQLKQSALLKAQSAKLVSKYQQAQQSNLYYAKEGLPLADEMTIQATLRLKTGDIGFAEWNLLVGQSLQIKIAYVLSIYEMQMAMAEYYYLTEKN
jgi:cobalt-zinc-cadmium resistance protein CzcA